MNRILKKIVKKYVKKLFAYQKRLEANKKNKVKAKLIKAIGSVGSNLKLNGEQHIISVPRKVLIGNNVHIGNNFYAKSEGGLILGSNTHISRNVTIYTENHNYTGKGLPYDNTTNYKPVIIKDNVWIGMNVSIVPGVTIGEGAIIGIGSVVNRDIDSYEIVGSPKIQKLKLRDIKHYETLKDNKHFGGVNGKVLNKMELSEFLASYQDNKDKDILFVIGTGRSGTVSITDLFNQHPNSKAFHEEMHQLIRISTDIAHKINLENQYNELKEIFKNKIWNASENQLIVHSDQRFWNLIPFLSNYFPNSKFIHLIREPVSCIKSMVIRGWYMDNEYPEFYSHDWAKYRLQGDLLDLFSNDDWSKMTSIQKCTWYYFYINNTIKEELLKLPQERRLKINLENVSQEIPSILKFSKLSFIELNLNKKNMSRKSDVKNIEKEYDSEMKKSIIEEIEKYK